MTEFERQVQAELKSLQDEVGEIEQEMVPLQQRLAKLNSKIDGLRQYLGSEEDPQVEKTPTRREEEKLSSLDRIESVLRRAGKPLNYLEILNRLKTEENFDIGGKEPKSNLTAKLSVSGRFHREGRGIYGLTEWINGKKKSDAPVNLSLESTGASDGGVAEPG